MTHKKGLSLGGKPDYNPSTIEKKWQHIWEKNKIYSPDLDHSKKPFYNLMMFPYPSAEGMHVGNMYAFTGADVYGRFMRMQGNDVFEPIGLDGFGIHSENFAIKVGRHPKDQAKISEKNFYRQLHATGNGFDWSRKLETYDPKYYKWTQWLFIQLFKAGLAYRAKAKVNWCPSCKTVLADEQVVQKVKSQPFDFAQGKKSKVKSTIQNSKIEFTVGVCERCETEVVKKDLEQWFFRITKYAERLLTNLTKLNWSEKVKIAQRQWIGRSEGARISFPVILGDPSADGDREDPIGISRSARNDTNIIDVFTTRPDTLYGATFLVLAPEHPMVKKILSLAGSHLAKLRSYVQEAKKKSEQERMAQEKEKTGVFTGLYAINPVNQEKIPVWIADYAVMGYGTGALFGDAHDERDVEFAKKYKIPLKVTVITGDKETDRRIKNFEECYTGYGILIDSGEFSGFTSEEAKKSITAWLKDHKSGGPEITYHLRDWLISRQRYWGPPIPIIFCSSCANKGHSWFTLKEEKVSQESRIKNQESRKERIHDSLFMIHNSMKGWYPDENLPVLLPDVEEWRPTGTGKSPLATVESFVNTKCPNCKGSAKRETDVSDTFLDSSWYFLRYLATDFDKMPFPSAALAKDAKAFRENSRKDIRDFRVFARRARWLPVNMYIGGAEHSVLHLLYSRFITMVLHDLGLVSFDEPFSRFFAHGLLIKEGAKMSKSKGNVVVPDEYIAKFGADSLRMYLMFLGPFSQGGDFYDSALEGMYRFVRRVWTLLTQSQRSKVKGQKLDQERLRMMNRTIKKVTEDISNLRYNTAIAALMEWHNYLSAKCKVQSAKLTQEESETYLKLLAPFAPHMTEELYQRIKKQESRSMGKLKKEHDSSFMIHDSIHVKPWPTYDPKYLEEEEVTIVVQINGKVRDIIRSQKLELRSQKIVEQLAKESDKVKKHLEGKKIKKVVYVEGKVINFVTND